jgi:hypothetical protein
MMTNRIIKTTTAVPPIDDARNNAENTMIYNTMYSKKAF